MKPGTDFLKAMVALISVFGITAVAGSHGAEPFWTMGLAACGAAAIGLLGHTLRAVVRHILPQIWRDLSGLAARVGGSRADGGRP